MNFKRKNKRFWTGIIMLLVLPFAACEKAVDFDLEEAPPKLVVEATIESGEAPRVVLTRSLNYFGAINPQLLLNSFVRNAEVFVSNGMFTHKLKEYSVPLSAGISVYYYSIDSSNLSTAFTGEEGKSYSLKIVSDGEEYNAQTTIPVFTRQIDSVWWKAPPPGVDSGNAIVMVKATDKPGYGDYVRYFTKRNSGGFLPGLNSVFDDLFIDGTTYEVQVEPGWNRSFEREEDDAFFKRGDTVTLKLSAIDKATYDFWRTMEYSYASVGNPFSTPVKIAGNISGSALGYFGGYASRYRTINIPR
ncbi:MAG: DUF4249 domain-containing protein [Chitinophagaceae bacterium]